MNLGQPQLRIEASSSPAKREKKGAHFAQQSGIDEGQSSASFTPPHLPHCCATGPLPLPQAAEEVERYFP